MLLRQPREFLQIPTVFPQSMTLCSSFYFGIYPLSAQCRDSLALRQVGIPCLSDYAPRSLEFPFPCAHFTLPLCPTHHTACESAVCSPQTTTTTYQYTTRNCFPSTGFLLLNVKAANDAHISLGNNQNWDTDDRYEIVLGGWANTQSVLRDTLQGTNVVVRSGAVLSASDSLPFWIGYSQRPEEGGEGSAAATAVISVGTGHNPSDASTVIMAHSFPSNRPVTEYSFSTGWGSEGVWSCPDDDDKPTSVLIDQSKCTVKHEADHSLQP